LSQKLPTAPYPELFLYKLFLAWIFVRPRRNATDFVIRGRKLSLACLLLSFPK